MIDKKNNTPEEISVGQTIELEEEKKGMNSCCDIVAICYDIYITLFLVVPTLFVLTNFSDNYCLLFRSNACCCGHTV